MLIRILMGIMLFCAASNHDLSAQYPEYTTLKECREAGRGVFDCYPELQPYFDQNILKIRDKLQRDDSISCFNEIVSFFSEDFVQNGLKIQSYMLAHLFFGKILQYDRGIKSREREFVGRMNDENDYERSYIISAEFPKTVQLRELLDLYTKRPLNNISELALASNALDYQKLTELHKNMPNKLGRILLYMNLGFTPIPIVDNDCIFSIEELNESFVNKIPLIGLPLSPSSYDGNQSANSDEFIGHDQAHVENITIFQGNAYHTIISYVMEELCNKINKDNFLHQFCYFMIFHEYFDVLDSDEFRSLSGDDILRKSIELTCAFILKNFSIHTQKLSRYCSSCSIEEDYDLEDKALDSFKDKSVLSIFEAFPELSKEKPLAEGNFPLSLMSKDTPYAFLNENFAEYNVLFDFMAMLQSENFKIWTQDGKFNYDGMKAVIEKIFNDFQSDLGL